MQNIRLNKKLIKLFKVIYKYYTLKIMYSAQQFNELEAFNLKTKLQINTSDYPSF